MTKTKTTGLIKIIKTPEGEAPLWIREAWVGLELPCTPVLGYPDDGLELGILSGKTIKNRCGFSVPQDQALTILGEGKPEAAQWWRENGYPLMSPQFRYFGFAEDEAVIISGVRLQELTLISTEEGMFSDPRR